MLVRKKRLELLRLTALEPKSSASTNSATLAGVPICYLSMAKTTRCILYLNLKQFDKRSHAYLTIITQLLRQVV